MWNYQRLSQGKGQEIEERKVNKPFNLVFYRKTKIWKMSSHDLRDKLDGITIVCKMDTVYPEAMSRLHKGVSVKQIQIKDFKEFGWKRRAYFLDQKAGHAKTLP